MGTAVSVGISVAVGTGVSVGKGVGIEMIEGDEEPNGLPSASNAFSPTIYLPGSAKFVSSDHAPSASAVVVSALSPSINSSIIESG